MERIRDTGVIKMLGRLKKKVGYKKTMYVERCVGNTCLKRMIK